MALKVSLFAEHGDILRRFSIRGTQFTRRSLQFGAANRESFTDAKMAQSGELLHDNHLQALKIQLFSSNLKYCSEKIYLL